MNYQTTEIPLAIVGCDFRRACSGSRALLVLDEKKSQKIVSDLRKSTCVHGFASLATCNRNEWIVVSHNPALAAELLCARMKKQAGKLWIDPYSFTEENAAQHLFRVALGQESLVVGERQIAHQLFDSLDVARRQGMSCRTLNGLGPIMGRLVRNAEKKGILNNVSCRGMHSLVVDFLKQRLNAKKHYKVAVVGLGMIGRKLQYLLEREPCFIPIYCNRTIQLNEREKVRPLEKLDEVLAEADAACVCTNAPCPVIQPKHLCKRNFARPLLLVDIGIPQQVVKSDMPTSVEVVDLDDLICFHRECNPKNILLLDKQIEQLIERATREYMVFCQESAYCIILDTVQKDHNRILYKEIPMLVAEHMGCLSEGNRAKFKCDLQGIVRKYTNHIFLSIKKSSVTKNRNRHDKVV